MAIFNSYVTNYQGVMDFLGNFWNDAEMMGKSVDWTNWKMPRPLALLNPPTRAKHDLRVAHHKSSTKGHQPIILRWRVTFSVVDVHSPNLLWFFLKVRSCFLAPSQHAHPVSMKLSPSTCQAPQDPYARWPRFVFRANKSLPCGQISKPFVVLIASIVHVIEQNGARNVLH